MIWIILIVVVLVIIIAAGSNKEKQNKILEERGFDISKKIDTGKYIAGHPDLDKTLKLTFILSKENELLIFEYPDGFISNMPRSVATISFSKIKDVIAEDASTIEKKVTVARMLAVGLFAFALKKKSKNELAYLTIEWSEGKFNHSTYFEFEGKEAMQKANTARNALIRMLR